MESVAKYKRAHAKAIDDLARETAMLAELEKKAAAHELSPNEVRAFFKQQIQAAKIVQQNWFAKWDKEDKKVSNDSHDLSAVRQRINAINDELLKSLKEFRRQPASIDNDAIAKRAQELLQGEGIDERARATAIETLLTNQ
jgi:chorismate mutase